LISLFQFLDCFKPYFLRFSSIRQFQSVDITDLSAKLQENAPEKQNVKNHQSEVKK